MSSGRRPCAPRSLLRPVRIVVLAGLALVLYFGLSDFSLLRLPGGEPVLFDYAGGAQVLVCSFSEQRPPSAGDAVLFRDGEQSIGFGRLVARAGGTLEIDLAQQRVRRSDSKTWYPATPKILAQLPLLPGQILVLAENPLRREAGAVLSERQLVCRVFAVLPF